MMTWHQWLVQAVFRLRESQSPSAKRDAEILLEQVTGAARTRLIAFGETLLTDVQNAELESLLRRRELGEPVAYLTGEREFWSLPLLVSTDTIIPRPETECLVQCTLNLLLPSGAKVLDLGTGSGAIALSLASERQDWSITGIDRLPGAVALARANAARLGLRNVQFHEGNWLEPMRAQSYHLIVANPPYMRVDDPYLMQGDVRFEPRSALVSGHEGLQDLEAICCNVGSNLEPGGWLVLEHGWQQGAIVRCLLSDAGFCHVRTLRDYGNNERVSQGQWSQTQD